MAQQLSYTSASKLITCDSGLFRSRDPDWPVHVDF